MGTADAEPGAALERWLGRAVFAIGVVAALVAVSSWQVPAAAGSPRIDVRFLANLTGELDVEPTGVFLRRSGMEAGTRRSSARGAFRIRNQTPVGLDVRVRARSLSDGLSHLLQVRIVVAGRQLFRGPLGRLRRASRDAVRLAPGESARVRVNAWLPQSARARYAEERADVTVELPARPVRR